MAPGEEEEAAAPQGEEDKNAAEGREVVAGDLPKEDAAPEEEEEENAAHDGEAEAQAQEPPEHDHTRRGEERHGEEDEVEVVEETAEWPEGSTGGGAGGLLVLWLGVLVESVVGTEGAVSAE